MISKALSVVFTRPGDLFAQRDNLARGGLFAPAPHPPPEPFADLTVRLVGPDGQHALLPARVVHIAADGAMTLSFADQYEARDLLQPLLDSVAGAAGEAASSPQVSWGDEDSLAQPLPEASCLGKPNVPASDAFPQPPEAPTSGVFPEPPEPPSAPAFPEPPEIQAGASISHAPQPPIWVDESHSAPCPGEVSSPPLSSTLDATMEEALQSAEAYLGGSDGLEARDETVGDGHQDFEAAEDEPSFEESRANLYDKIRSMTVNERIKLAKHGDRTARTLLIRDVNKTIHVHVVMNPHISIDEVRFIAGYKQTNPEALKMIADHREWVQNPRVVSALVANPKTPTPVAVKLLEKLPLSELRRIAKSDSYPRSVTMAARKKVIGP